MHAHQLLRRPAEQTRDRAIGRAQRAGVIDGDDGIQSRVEDRAQMLLAGLELKTHAAVAQQRIDRHHEYRQSDGQQRDGNGDITTVDHRHRSFGLRRTDETRRSHAGVVHATDRQAHHQGAEQKRPERRQTPLQTEAYPQRQNGQGDGNDDGQGEHPGVIAQQRCHLHRRHTAVVHGTDTCPDQYTTHTQLHQAQITPRQQAQRDPRSSQARQHRQ